MVPKYRVPVQALTFRKYKIAWVFQLVFLLIKRKVGRLFFAKNIGFLYDDDRSKQKLEFYKEVEIEQQERRCDIILSRNSNFLCFASLLFALEKRREEDLGQRPEPAKKVTKSGRVD